MSQTKKYHQYFSTRPVISITMPNTSRIRFVGGVYMTDKEAEIEFLDEQVKNGHSMIFVKSDQKTVDADALDPLASVKKRAVEEYLAQQRLANDPNRDLGSTVANLADSISTTKSIAAISKK